MSAKRKSTEQDYKQAAEWAERDMALKPNSTSAMRGKAAAAHGRELLERATGGRPSLDSNARRGEHSPIRQVRLPAEVNDQLTAIALAERRSPSDVIRSALSEYLATHAAG